MAALRRRRRRACGRRYTSRSRFAAHAPKRPKHPSLPPRRAAHRRRRNGAARRASCAQRRACCRQRGAVSSAGAGRPEAKAPSLSPVERKAFRELAQELTARLRGAQQRPAAAESALEGSPPKSRAPAEAAAVAEAAAAAPAGDVATPSETGGARRGERSPDCGRRAQRHGRAAATAAGRRASAARPHPGRRSGLPERLAALRQSPFPRMERLRQPRCARGGGRPELAVCRARHRRARRRRQRTAAVDHDAARRQACGRGPPVHGSLERGVRARAGLDERSSGRTPAGDAARARRRRE